MSSTVSLSALSAYAGSHAFDVLDKLQSSTSVFELGSRFDAKSRISDIFTPARYCYEFDQSDLYGPSGNPSEQDIQQNSIGDCYFVATLGAVADQQPGRIKDAISYNPLTGTFSVKMYKPDGTAVTIPVTQQDILDNKSRAGGSKLDNGGGPIWPAVMETAYAKMNDGNWSDGLAQGYNKIGAGGFGRDGTMAVTGSSGTDLVPATVWFFPTTLKSDILFNQVSAALAQGKPVTLSTDPESGTAQDGLIDNHVYVVDRIYKDANGNVKVELRNPWGTNINAGEGTNTSSATITADLNTLINTHGLECFNVGP
jgi:hypothetical protein